MVLTTLSLATALITQPPMMTAQKYPMLLISKIQAMDNLDQGDALGANRADFYAKVKINKTDHVTEAFSADTAEPNWTFPLDMKQRVNKIHLSLWDDDGGLERTDDHVDISPKKGQKDLWFYYDRYTGKIWGDVDGSFGQTIVSIGSGDDDKAKIYLSIIK
ncbi:MAG: hypothetical protein KF824_08290 [Fimbriimonadaceae bacterium]|nr:MAG: hypothetical protein KF824_08290 [Fimbriimonadaceae bacterium]